MPSLNLVSGVNAQEGDIVGKRIRTGTEIRDTVLVIDPDIQPQN